jgi:hypothetical protein
MAVEIKQVYLQKELKLRRIPGSVGGFLWHFVQMVLAMEAGMMIYHMFIWPLLAGTSYAALTKAYPLFGYWMMAVSMALGMLALMLYHRSTWRYCGEMTIAMLAPVAALTVLVLCSLIPIQLLYGLGDPVMILAMAAYMLYCPHEHAHSAHGHGSHQHANVSDAEATGLSAHEVHETCEHEHAA